MTFQQELLIELIKLAVGFLGVTLIGGAFTAFWTTRQKQRDVEHLELTRFYELYGHFLTAWRLWNTIQKDSSVTTPDEINRSALLKRASEAEGALEGMLLKLASERRLSHNDQQTLGKFRQACQRIRQSIRDDQLVPWSSSEHPEYLAFKQGASYLTSLIPQKSLGRSPSQAAAAKAVCEITSNKYNFTP
jgi:hypothetical protein